MKRVIWKFPLKLIERQTVRKQARHFQPLAVDVQNGAPALWAAVVPGPLSNGIAINMVGTGWPVPERCGSHLGTIQLDGMVWHFFLDSISAGVKDRERKRKMDNLAASNGQIP